ncbi:MAG TPA: hypothetical protein VFH78_13810 [Candidatus Thermoplasmatota archaeon]|nr:hypothetical protein [Candidatus Thermoplasmatota archaeon]
MRLVPPGKHMQKPTTPPLAKSVSRDVLDWDHVEPRRSTTGKDGLGLSPEDRQALGLSAPRTTDLEAPSLGGAEAALADVLARGGAIGKPEFRRKR